MTWLVVVAAAAVALGVAGWFLSARQHPEQAAFEAARGGPAGESGVSHRPAGPDAENMSADQPGGFTPPAPPAGRDTVESDDV
jgi:hypothetical protein